MINLADIVAASNGKYDNVVIILNLIQPVASIMIACFIGILVCILICAVCYKPHSRTASLLRTMVVFGVLLCVGLVYLSVTYTDTKKSSPTVLDVIETSYNIEALSTSESSLSTYHFVDSIKKNRTAQVTFNDNGDVLNTIVVIDDRSNVYVVNTDTNEIVPPEVNDSEKVAKLLLEKY